MKNLTKTSKRNRFSIYVRTIIASSNINRRGLKLIVREPAEVTVGWLPKYTL